MRTAPENVPTVMVDDPFTGQLIEIEQGAAAPLYPPDEWFSQRAADEAVEIPAGAQDGPLKLAVYPGGRVAAVVAPAGRCLVGSGQECWMAPRPQSEREYDRAHQGYTKAASGAMIPTAVIGGGKGHASEFASAANAQAFYADTSTQLMRGRYIWSDKAGGLCFVGALWPEVNERQQATILASPASIDYRWIMEEGDYRLAGACLVNVPGFPARWKMAARRVASCVLFEPVPVMAAATMADATGVMLALRIDAPGLAMGVDPAELHLTLGMFEEAVLYPPEVQAAAVTAVEQTIIAAGLPLLLEVNGVGVLGPPDDLVTVLLMQGDQLCELREILCAAVASAGLMMSDEYPVWFPHVTVGPLEVLNSALAMKGVTVSPPSVVLAFGGDWHEFPLPLVGAPFGDVSLVAVNVAASVIETEEAAMDQCAACGGTKVAAPPASTDQATPDLAAQVADLDARVSALEAMVSTQAAALARQEMNHLAAMPVAMPALV